MSNFDDYVFFNRLGLTFLGIWPLGKNSTSVLGQLFSKFHKPILFVFLFILLIPEWLDMVVLWGNLDAVAETFVLNVFTLCAMIKLICFIVNFDEYKQVLLNMKTNWENTMDGKNESHQELIRLMAERGRSYTKRYGLMMYGTATMYFFSPFLGMQSNDIRVRKYPFFGWYYFDRLSLWYYALCYFSQLCSGLIVGTGNYSMDSIFAVAMYHQCAQLLILQNDVEKLGTEKNDDERDREVRRIIQKHQLEIRNSEKLQRVFGGPSLQQLVVSCIIICIIGFKLILALDNGINFEVMVYIAFMFVALLQIFLYCSPGDELIFQSQKIGYAAGQSSWMKLKPTSVLQVMMLIMRAQKPLAIIAGKLYKLSLPNFTLILKTSASFLSLLRAMYN